MKKTALIIISLLLLLLLLLYTLLFTAPGNALLRPVIESKINKNSPLKVSLETFVLRTDRVKLLLTLDEENSFAAEGVYSLFSQSFDLDYRLGFTRLSRLSSISKRRLSGALMSDGKVSGDLDLFKIKGKSDLARSDTDYAIIVKEMKLDKAAIKLSDLNIAELLVMAGEKPYAQGNIDLHLKLFDLTENDMRGSVLLKLKEARLNAKTVHKEFGVALAKTGIQSQLNASFQGNDLTYSLNLDSELATLFSQGKMQLQEKAVNASYTVDIKELSLLKSITNTPLRGPLFTQGEISGNQNHLIIKGKSDIASSQSSYDISLDEMKLSQAIIHVKDGRLKKLLHMASQSEFADAKINANIQFDDLSAQNLKGEAVITLSEGKFDQKIMKKEFDITLPATHFELQTKTGLSPENIHYTLLLESNLARIDSSGDIKPKNMGTEARYNVNIKELALLKPLTKAPLRGPIATSGKISGDREELKISGTSNLAASKTSYTLTMKNMALHSAQAAIAGAELSKLLYLVGKNDYAQGKLSLDADISSFTPLSAKTKLSVVQGQAQTKAIQKDFDITLPHTKFTFKSDATLKDNLLSAESKLDSNLATLTMKKTDLNLDTSALASDYLLFIPSLERLESILGRKLYGPLTLNGDVKKDKKLFISAHSDLFKGHFDAKLIDEQLNADFKGIHAIAVLKMLGYPEVMDAPINGSLSYNTASKKGRFQSRFEQATLVPSQFTKMIRQFSSTDLSKERFNEGMLNSDINKEIISSELQMQSKNVTMKSKRFILNSEKELIDARFSLKVKQYPGDIIVKGDINTPKVTLDAKSMITPEIEEKVGKEINRFLKKLF
ncbi:MAG: hypothetical protein IBX43_03130 [Campylobacterales bacterium]|nr:hypothetical protein [Campylobacterales bacterium]